MTVKFRSRFNYGDNKQYFSSTDQPSLTDPRYKDCCDLSRVVTVNGDHLFIENPDEFEKALKLSDYKSMYEDVSKFGTYFDVQKALTDAQNRFMDLPSSVRNKYHNNVDEFLSAIGMADANTVTPTVSEKQEQPTVAPVSAATVAGKSE